MAPRLSIVISQAPTHDASIADVEQAIVTALMFEPGMDPMLIGHLEGIQSGTTDHLCLEGVRGDFVLLGWLPTQSAYDQLARLGIFARPGVLPTTLQSESPVVAHYPVPAADLAGEAGSAASLLSATTAADNVVSLPVVEQLKRRLYFVDLRSHSKRDPKTILQGLKDLLQDRQTKTFSLQLGAKPSSASTSVVSTPKIVPPVAMIRNEVSDAHVATASTELSRSEIPSRAEAHSSVTPLADDADDPQWQQLDQLFDDFDSLEI